MAVKNKTARMIIAAFELKKLKAEEEAKKTFLRAFDAEDAEEVVDALENAEEENIDDVEDADNEDEEEKVDDIDASEDEKDDEDEDKEEELTDDEVLEEVEAKVSELKAAAKLKARKKFLD